MSLKSRKPWLIAGILLWIAALNGCGSNSPSGGGSPSPSANAMWTWWTGTNTYSGAGQYGTLGAPASANTPGARVFANTWTDSSGNLWLFGGTGLDASGSGGLLSDLWSFSPTNKTWTWVGGNSLQGGIGNYGTIGVGASGNFPGARQKSLTWTDKNGNLWLFGGQGFDSTGAVGELNDLWKFVPATATWTWVAGSDTVNAAGSYGSRGVAAASNAPGAREGAVGWTDASGNFWIFGGSGFDSTGAAGLMSDIWRFDPSAAKWIWVSGPSTTGAFGDYGTAFFPPSAGTPGAREMASGWTDTFGNMWLFGGRGYDSAVVQPLDPLPTLGLLNDLWEYNPKKNQWTWVSGTYLTAGKGSYGTKGSPAAANTPGARAGAVAWTDTSGRLFVFGGSYQNDLWLFDPASQLWTWVSGTNSTRQPADYGKRGTSADSNVPGGRRYSAGWVDSTGNLWLFGGDGFDSTGLVPSVPPIPTYPGLLNDMWAYHP